ncbi:ERF family protein [Tardiphaga sp.]|jgi:hypothetical protein|uniref:ERF family protein n=1 Tax=Tardiphaga sp. TaxID=1926292 RepID=UPI0037DA5A79
MSNAVEKMDTNRADDRALSVVTPMDMLNRAVESGATMEVLEKLMSLQERYEANQAHKAFDEAVSNAKAEIGPVVRNKAGHNNKRYADFAAIARSVDPIISKFGLSYRFKTDQSDKIAVTCILSHRMGHSEQTTLTGPADTSGNKNAIQSLGSTLTYLQRYSLVQMLGLAASDDDDGRTAGAGECISDEQADNIRDLLEANGKDRARFLKWAKVDRIEDLPAANYDTCVAAITRKAD